MFELDGMDHEIDGASGIGGGEHALPIRAGIGRTIYAAVWTRSPLRTQRRNEDRAGILRIDDHSSDVARRGKPHVGPSDSAVRGTKDPCAAVSHAPTPAVRLTRAHPDHFRVRRIDRHRSDRKCGLVVEERHPGKTRIRGLEDPARCRAGIDHVQIRRVAGDIRDATADIRRTHRIPQAGRTPAGNRLKRARLLIGEELRGRIDVLLRPGALAQEPIAGILTGVHLFDGARGLRVLGCFDRPSANHCQECDSDKESVQELVLKKNFSKDDEPILYDFRMRSSFSPNLVMRPLDLSH